MALWRQLGLQEGIRIPMEIIISFHDYMIVILVGIIFLVTSIRVSLLSNPGIDKYLSESHLLEFFWTVLPIVVLLIMAFPSLYLLYLTEDTIIRGAIIKVVGHQWYWEYQYSNVISGDTVGSAEYNSYMLVDGSSPSMFRNLDVDNRMVIPSSVSRLVMVTSADVLHSWTVPSLGVKVDAVPGRLNYLTLSPSSSGVYYGQCSELCGSNHSFIPIVVESVGVLDYIKSLSLLSDL
jgi:cytochrome c oxidase subunit 2